MLTPVAGVHPDSMCRYNASFVLRAELLRITCEVLGPSGRVDEVCDVPYCRKLPLCDTGLEEAFKDVSENGTALVGKAGLWPALASPAISLTPVFLKKKHLAWTELLLLWCLTEAHVALSI